MHTHCQTSTNVLKDYCDGKCFHEHPLFSADPVALQLILYYDEVELCNALGSRRKKHKIGLLFVLHSSPFITIVSKCTMVVVCDFTGAFYYLLGNISPHFRSKIHNIQLLLLANSSSVAEYGIDHIIKPIVEDIKKLESVCTLYVCMHRLLP